MLVVSLLLIYRLRTDLRLCPRSRLSRKPSGCRHSGGGWGKLPTTIDGFASLDRCARSPQRPAFDP